MSVFDNYSCDGQLSLFDYNKELFKIDKPVRLIELFAGVGSQAIAYAGMFLLKHSKSYFERCENGRL